MPTVNWTFVCGFVEPVVWIDVVALDRVWRGSDAYIGRGGAGSRHGARYQRVGAFIRGSAELYYPHVNLDGDTPVFTDGRHRFAWLRDHGAEAVAVTTSEAEVSRLRTLFGTTLRETRYV